MNVYSDPERREACYVCWENGVAFHDTYHTRPQGTIKEKPIRTLMWVSMLWISNVEYRSHIKLLKTPCLYFGILTVSDKNGTKWRKAFIFPQIMKLLSCECLLSYKICDYSGEVLGWKVEEQIKSNMIIS